MVLPSNVICVCLFGSMARKDHDKLSDADILVVVKDRTGKVPQEIIYKYVCSRIGRIPTVSWYGNQRLQTMFNDGHLFAWHLHRESKLLWGDADINEIFGEPAPYQDALVDISSFQTVLDGVPFALRRCPGNAIYEMGLLYVCIRNIAMSASWHLCDAPDFTRHSPFNLKTRPFSISRVEYELTMSCRMASQRGTSPNTPVTARIAIELHDKLISWTQDIVKDVETHVRQ